MRHGAGTVRTSTVVRVVIVSMMTTLVATGCEPHDQVMVVRDPASGQPLAAVGLCDGERVEALRLRPDEDRAAPILWEIERLSDDELHVVALGAEPPGFRTVHAADGTLPSSGFIEVSLSGGGAALSGATFDLNRLPALDQAAQEKLARSAQENCGQRPFQSSWLLTALTIAGAAALFGSVVRRSAASRRRPLVRPALSSPWSYLTAVMGLTLVGILWSGSYGQRSEPATYLFYGTVLGLAALGLALLGRLARRKRFLDWLVLVPGIFLLFVVGVVATIEGFFVCGSAWTFDCTTSLLDRLALLACFTPAWVTSVWLAEGGWWDRLWPRRAEDPQGWGDDRGDEPDVDRHRP